MLKIVCKWSICGITHHHVNFQAFFKKSLGISDVHSSHLEGKRTDLNSTRYCSNEKKIESGALSFEIYIQLFINGSAKFTIICGRIEALRLRFLWGQPKLQPMSLPKLKNLIVFWT